VTPGRVSKDARPRCNRKLKRYLPLAQLSPSFKLQCAPRRGVESISTHSWGADFDRRVCLSGLPPVREFIHRDFFSIEHGHQKF
jgi:hypothetical protein